MAGHNTTPAEYRPASNRQLWRLNTLGLLRLVEEEGDYISAADAKAVIARECAREARESNADGAKAGAKPASSPDS